MSIRREAAWFVRLFGALQVESKDGIAKFRTRKTAQLVALLSLRKSARLSRGVVADMFWPETSSASSKQSLRMALTDIRDVLGADAIVADNEWLSLNSDVVVSDVAMFEHLVSQSKEEGQDRFLTLAEALNLAKEGPLIGCDMEWAIAEQLRINDQVGDAALELTGLAATDDQRQQAIQIAKRTLRIVGLREDLHLGLMKLYVSSGLPSMAIAQYEELERALSEEWGERPSAAALQLLESIPKVQDRAIGTGAAMPRNKRTLLGRSDLLKDTIQLLQREDSPPILTLIGPGGSGKTSLAIAVGRKLSTESSVPVRFVDLIKAYDERELSLAIALAVGLDPSIAEQSMTVLGRHLAHTGGLLILDNFEQLPEACAIWISRLVRKAPDVKILITSRAALRTDGEQLVMVPPLETPGGHLTLAEARLNPAIKLFELEAQSANPRFQVTAGNVSAVIELCRRLDGLPLAIELAAARMASQSPAQALAEIQHSALTLTTSNYRSEDRHKSLWETVAWSYRLLSPLAQEVFLRMSMFRSRFRRDAIEAQMGGRDIDEAVKELIGTSIFNIDLDGEEAAYWMLETMKDFAREQLRQQPYCEDARRNHVLYWSEWADRTRFHSGLAVSQWVTQFVEASPELSAAIEAGLEFETLLEANIGLLKHMSQLLHLPKLTVKCAPLAKRTLLAARKSGSERLLCEACDLTAIMLMNSTEGALAVTVLDEAIGLSSHNQKWLSQLYYRRGHVFGRMRRYEDAQRDYELALEYADPTDVVWCARLQLSCGRTLRTGGFDRSGVAYIEKALQGARLTDTPILLAHSLDCLAHEYGLLGRLDEAFEMSKESLAIIGLMKSINIRQYFLATKARLHIYANQLPEAYRAIRESVTLALELDEGNDPKRVSAIFATSLRGLGHVETAASILGKAYVPGTTESTTLTNDERNESDAERAQLNSLLGEAKLNRLMAEGRETPWDDLLATCDVFVTATSLS